MSPEERGARLEKAQGCFKCTSWLHQAKDCRDPRTEGICKFKEGSQVCNGIHNEVLHGSKNTYCEGNSIVNMTTNERGELVLLGVQKVEVKGANGRSDGILFFDSGSTLTLCRHQWAR